MEYMKLVTALVQYSTYANKINRNRHSDRIGEIFNIDLICWIHLVHSMLTHVPPCLYPSANEATVNYSACYYCIVVET